MPARGVLYVHSCPAAVCPHIEWALARVLGVSVNMQWRSQPIEPATYRAECQWRGKPGTASELANALRTWGMLRFEVTEEPSHGVDGERIAHVPGLGVHRSTMSANGDVLISEGRIRNLLGSARDSQELSHGLDKLLGTEWDTELEPYRLAGEGSPATFLHQAG
ncbi:MAG: DUF3145 domain-containing protein [Corynebacteriales bacterium]|nr:DUF3145 domain-containing protein [Mycobacteriales bacterium]